MEQKHILIVSQYFYPEQFRINDIAVEWVKRGYKVTVLTGIPNYPQGKFFEGYGWRKKRRETWNGVDIIRLPIIARGHSSVGLVFNYFSFVVSGYFWKVFTKLRPDTVFTYEVSPMTQALIGVWFSKKRKIPNVLYVTDLWPQNVEIITGIHSKLIIGPISKMVNYIYKRCDKILISSKSFKKDISSRIECGNESADEKIIYWPQYAEDFYKPLSDAPQKEIPRDGVFNIVFAGNIGYAQGLGILVDVAKQLKEKALSVRFNIIGDGRFKPELTDKIKSAGTEQYFNFIDRKPAEEIPEYFFFADALLICLSKSEVFSMTIPAKTQSCMACGKPILVSADGEVQEIIRDSGSGLASNAEDADGLRENIIKMMNMTLTDKLKLGENALRYSLENFNKSKLLDYAESILF